jgi:hypothetical protein
MDAHEREAAGAVAAVSNKPLEPGERVIGYAEGMRFTGTLFAVQGDRCYVKIDIAWITCRPCDIERYTDG